MPWLKFQKKDDYDEYMIINKKGQCIGQIHYNSEWNKWVWSTDEDCKFTWDCTIEIGNFVKSLG